MIQRHGEIGGFARRRARPRSSLGVMWLGAIALVLGATEESALASGAPPAAPPPGESAAPPRSLEPGFSEGQPPTDVVQELSEISTRRRGSLAVPEAERPLDYLSGRAAELEEATGLRLGFAYTMLFQQASGGPGDRSAASGDVDLLAKWTLVGRGTKDFGQLVFAGEYRHQIGSQPPSALGGEIGTLIPTTNGFSERPMVVKEAYWIQRLFDDRLRVGLGRADSENLFGGHQMQSANTFFLNKAFSSNPTVSYPGSGTTAGASFRPVEHFFIAAGAANAYGRTTTMEIDELLEEWKLFTFGEVGFTPEVDGLGKGRYRVALWHIDEREKTGGPEDEGISLIIDQELGRSVQSFARYGYADGRATGVRTVVEAGLGLKGLLGSEDNLTGVAAAWAEPYSDEARDEKIVEVFHRWQVTAQSQFTIGVEVIMDPGRAPDDDVLGVFSARLRLTF